MGSIRIHSDVPHDFLLWMHLKSTFYDLWGLFHDKKIIRKSCPVTNAFSRFFFGTLSAIWLFDCQGTLVLWYPLDTLGRPRVSQTCFFVCFFGTLSEIWLFEGQETLVLWYPLDKVTPFVQTPFIIDSW